MKRAFGDRLRRAFSQPESQREPETGAEVYRDEARPQSGDALRTQLQRRQARQVARLPQIELPPGEVQDTAAGPCYLRTLRYPWDALHGAMKLGEVHGVDRVQLAALAKCPDVVDLDLADCLFLDTETTGLSGGAGTIVFMVGMGYCTPDAFVLEQTFLRTFGEEPAALTLMAQRLTEHPHLVSFVGKSFDRHRLASRMAVHKIRSQLFTPRHLDLYYMARRVWKDELPDVKLQTVEKCKLGLLRSDDMPGSEAPMAFLDWIRDGTGRVDRVFEHNRLDVLTLVTLLAKLGPPSG